MEGWIAFKAACSLVPRQVWIALGALALLVLIGWRVVAWDHDRLAAEYERGRTDYAAEMEAAQAKADAAQRKTETLRDDASLALGRDTTQAAEKAVRKTKDATHERAAQIAAVPVSGACVAPDGLPALGPAVAAANAAHR